MVSYRRILLKLSGEALASDNQSINPEMLKKVVNVVQSALDLGVEVAIVIGGGNFFRGANLALNGMNKITGDHIGMLATVMNALAVSDAFERHNIPCEVMSGFSIGGGVCDSFDHKKAKNALSEGKVVIFSAGTGSPCFTTDTAAALRAVEINADGVFKATKVDGIYTDDPVKNKNATRIDRLNYDEAITKNLKVMDATAFTLCKEQNMPIGVINIFDKDSLYNFITSKESKSGTLVTR